MGDDRITAGTTATGVRGYVLGPCVPRGPMGTRVMEGSGAAILDRSSSVLEGGGLAPARSLPWSPLPHPQHVQATPLRAS